PGVVVGRHIGVVLNGDQVDPGRVGDPGAAKRLIGILDAGVDIEAELRGETIGHRCTPQNRADGPIMPCITPQRSCRLTYSCNGSAAQGAVRAALTPDPSPNFGRGEACTPVTCLGVGASGDAESAGRGGSGCRRGRGTPLPSRPSPACMARRRT